MDDAVFYWLQQWYHDHCNEDWEHGYGITIRTIDNPGWRIEINLVETELEGANFSKICLERDENDWVRCEVINGQFQAACGPMNLIEMLGYFRQWAIGKKDIS